MHSLKPFVAKYVNWFGEYRDKVHRSPGRRCRSALALTATGCHSLGIYILILLSLLSLLSLSVKMTDSPRATAVGRGRAPLATGDDTCHALRADRILTRATRTAGAVREGGGRAQAAVVGLHPDDRERPPGGGGPEGAQDGGGARQPWAVARFSCASAYGVRGSPYTTQTGRHESDVTGHGYNAFGVFGTIFREPEWKMPIFSWRVVPKTPNAS
jgi:hypothetical protein